MQKRKGAEPQIRVIFDLSRWHLPGVWWVRNLEQSGSGESMGIRDKTQPGQRRSKELDDDPNHNARHRSRVLGPFK